jgi:small subunit ribosomal protein S20
VPKLRSSKKKLRQARAHHLRNRAQRSAIRTAVKKARSAPTAESVRAAARALDRGAGKGQIHRNTAARKKSRLAKLLQKSKQGG